VHFWWRIESTDEVKSSLDFPGWAYVMFAIGSIRARVSLKNPLNKSSFLSQRAQPQWLSHSIDHSETAPAEKVKSRTGSNENAARLKEIHQTLIYIKLYRF
jgi:hypothetical protein